MGALRTPIAERVMLLLAQVTSLHARADGFERVAAELRTEAAAATSELTSIRREIERRDRRAAVRTMLDDVAAGGGFRRAASR